MKLSKSKLALAKVINENGGWVDGSEICSYNKHIRQCVFYLNGFRAGGFDANPFHNWHQCALSREEYYQAYPKADADGWIAWGGLHVAPVKNGVEVDIKFRDGDMVTVFNPAYMLWSHHESPSDIIAYRLHKQEVKPEFCESVTRSIPEPESIDGLCAKVTEENKHQHVDAKPTIEQLVADYRNAKGYAERKQKEADDAKAYADARLKTLELAGEAIGLLVSPITAKQWPELVIAVQVGDEVECIKSNVNPGKYMGRIGTVSSVDVDDTSTPYLVDFDGEAKIWCHEVKFIRRP